MKTVLNRVNPKGLENRQIYLQDLRKPEILEWIYKVAASPQDYYLANYEDLPEDDKTPAVDMYTLSEVFEAMGLEPTKGEVHKIARVVADRFRDIYGHPPRKITRPDSRQRYVLKVNGFEHKDLWIVKEAIKSVMTPEFPQGVSS